MIVNPDVSPLWLQVPTDALTRTCDALDDLAAGSGGLTVFFRADDIAAPGKNFTTMAQSFVRHGQACCMAVVPAWMTEGRWRSLSCVCEHSRLFCWGMHGWRHVNYEPEGKKKREFGGARPAKEKAADLKKGRDKLAGILGRDFTPVFTPPWNRVDADSLETLAELGFTGVSRTIGASPDLSPLPDFPICPDLHTRKEADPGAAVTALVEEIRKAARTGGPVGFMLHHQRMNESALDFLDGLLEFVAGHSDIRTVHFGDLATRTA